MIYDFQDIATKIYITHMVRVWANTRQNALIILQNPKVKELTEADLSIKSTDDVVWTILYLIGVGLLHYIVSANGDQLDIALNPHWKKPKWINNRLSKQRLNRHIDLLMDAESLSRQNQTPLTALVGSLEIAKYHNWCRMAPREPNLEPEKEAEIVKRNRKLHAAKLQFHRGH